MFDEEVLCEKVFTDNELELINEEYSRIKGICYLDHIGCPPYSASILKESFKNLSSNIYGNPHSGNLSSKFCLDTVDQARFRILKHFNTSASEYSVIFTSGATASLKLVAESFIWAEDADYRENEECDKSYFAYMEDNHTSVLGMRDVVAERGAEVVCLDQEKIFEVFKKVISPPKGKRKRNSLFVYSAQSNFSGVKYPLKWIDNVHFGALNSVHNNEKGGTNWYCLLDAASYVSTNLLDLSIVKPDFVAISFYKMFGYPTGLGALLVHNSAAHLLKKSYYGGGTVFVALSQENSHVPRKILHERFEDGTLNFLAINVLSHGFNFLEKIGGMDKISRHCFSLAQYAYTCLGRLHHGNGNPVAVIYNDTPYDNIKTQGNVLNFNLLRPNGEHVGFAEVLNLSNLHGIHLRTGCFCNPGACRRHLNLTTDDVRKHFMAGHVCGDDHDLVDGQPTGSIRISFGHYSTMDDVDKLLNMIADCFVQKPLIQRFPDDWGSKFVQLQHKIVNTSCETIKINERLRSMYFIYFWLENMGDVMPQINLEDNSRTLLEEVALTKKSELNENGLSTPHLSHIFLYPVKSCGKFCVKSWELCEKGLRYDREWMITTHEGVALTQKNEPNLCLIKPVVDLDRGKLILKFKGYPQFSVPLEEDGEAREAWLCSSKVCGDQIRGHDCGDAVSLWLSHVLARDGLRLVRLHQRHSNSPGVLSLSNKAQYLMINKTSVDWLSNKLDDSTDCKKESMLDRFRSNFVISSLSLPFEEQHWSEVKIGSHNFKVDGPCGRCQMICIDQDTGTKTKEPLTTLAASFKGKLKFGIYLTLEGTSKTSLSVGDSVSFKLPE